MHQRRRLTVRAAACLVAGALATAAAAWSSVCFPSRSRPTVQVAQSPDLAWPAPVPRFWPAPHRIEIATGPGLRSTHWEGVLPRGRRGLLDFYAVHDLRAGWPLPALRTRRHLFAQSPDAMTTFKSRTGLPPRFGDNTPALPITPLWPGFLIDTAFWSVAAFVFWSVPGVMRRRSRRRRGRCPRCGYDLAGLGRRTCPECAANADHPGHAAAFRDEPGTQ